MSKDERTRDLVDAGYAWASWRGRPLPEGADAAAYRLGLRLERGELEDDDFPMPLCLEDDD